VTEPPPRAFIFGVAAAVAVGLALIAVAAVLIFKPLDRQQPPPPPPPDPVFNVTIPEGPNRHQVAVLVKRAGVHGDYLKASVRSKLLNPRRFGGKRARSLEGFLFPATYELPVGAGVKALVSRQLAAFRQQLAGVDQAYARHKNLTTYDVVTIASMVEREVLVPAERPLVAAVIYNRLHKHMPLGIDATVRFATGNFDQPLKQSELNSPSPYNTRKFAGLPPGPIGNPGLASIQAAAKPARVRYLFYVVKPGTCGQHSFAKTEAEFTRLVARYDQARQAAGGKSPTKC
jgi:peptidoglycan lytic transglycosylase G